MAGLGVPVQRNTTELAAYPLILLLTPLVDAYLLLSADIFQAVAMLGYAIIIELDNESTGKFRAVGTPDDPFCGQGASSYLALGAEQAAWPITEAAFTTGFFNRDF